MSEPNLFDLGEQGQLRAKPEPALLITVEQLAARLNLSKRTVYRLLSAGAMIEPIRLGGTVRWRVAEVEAWIAAGCPARLTWEAMPADKK